MDSPQEQSISWNVQTHEHVERSVDWFWGLGLIAGVGALLSIFFGNFLFACILLLGAGSIAVLMVRGPREHSVKLDSRGISIDGTLYRFDSLHSFWIERTENPRLLVTTGGILSPQMIIPLLDERRAQNVRSFLKKYVTEKEQHPHIGDIFAQMFGL